MTSNFRKQVLVFGFIVFICQLVATGQKRYQDIFFKKTDSIVNVQYGKATNISGEEEKLLLDVFLPPKEDKVRYRPLLIFVHGGGFSSNTKSSILTSIICNKFAQKGYVAATIDYRLGVEQPKGNVQYLEAMYRAQQDAKAAVRYFRSNSELYGIDKSQIFIAGASAGGMTALAVAYMDATEVPNSINKNKWGDLDGTSGNPGASSKVQGVINCWGALPNLSWLQKNDVPLFNTAGTADKTVPYDSSYDWHGFKYGGYILFNQSQKLGIATGWLPFDGAGHSLNSNPKKYDSCADAMSNWLSQHLDFNLLQKTIPLFTDVKKVNIQKPAIILSTMEKVADWQMNLWEEKGYKYQKWHWSIAAGYTGYTELSKISKNKRYHQKLLSIANELEWQTGPSRFFADDYCVAQTYASLYNTYKQPKMLAKFQLLADSILAQPHTVSLDWKDSINYREWAWCDALFMGPPSLGYLSTALKQPKYLDLAVKLWWKTHNYLYDSTEQLYFRDQRFFNQREKNGKKVFWSRGNGWVLAGLVRLLDNMPKNYKDRVKFESLYKTMVTKVASLQQADGSWHASLLDPDNFSSKEVSGTGFYTYAICWGLNNGMLDKAKYLPIVTKGWQVMLTAIQQDGKLGFIQPIGAAPDVVNENSTEPYGIGAFLLTGSQLYKYFNNNKG